MSAPVYLDYNATTPVDPDVADAIEPYLNLSFPDVDGRELLLLDAKEEQTLRRRKNGQQPRFS